MMWKRISLLWLLGIAVALVACGGSWKIDPYLRSVVERANAELEKSNASSADEKQMTLRFDGGKLLLTMKIMKLENGNIPEEMKRNVEILKIALEQTSAIIIEMLKMSVNRDEPILTDEFFSRLKSAGIDFVVVVQARNGDKLAKGTLNLDNKIEDIFAMLAKAQRGGKDYVPYEEKPNDKVFMVDGFPAVKIGEQIWMAENLDIKTPNSVCYENEPDVCAKGGRLYTIEEARTVCPEGWHLPDNDEFDALVKYAGDSKKLLSDNYDEWIENNAGTDDFGFRLRPSGWLDYTFQGGRIGAKSEGVIICGNCAQAFLWTSTDPQRRRKYWNEINLGYYVTFPDYKIKTYSIEEDRKDKIAMAVRCVKGKADSKERTFETFQDERDGKVYRFVDIKGQKWMAENLNFKTDSSKCFNDDEKLCDELGRLYTRKDALTVCPAGWHLPDTSEFKTLLNNAGSAKSLLYPDDWSEQDAGTDDYGFGMLPAGEFVATDFRERYRWNRSCGGYNYGCRGYLWTSTNSLKKMNNEGVKNLGYYILFPDFSVEEFSPSAYNAKTLLSVRCVMGEPVVVNPDPYEVQTFIDSRDSRTYKSVTIGGQTWMAENLNFSTKGSTCYNNQEANCLKFGRLYSGVEARTVCPAGWHLPSVEEWDRLYEFVEEQAIALFAKDAWVKPGLDEYNFAILPGGYRYDFVSYHHMSLIAYFWTSSLDSYYYQDSVAAQKYMGFKFEQYSMYNGPELLAVRFQLQANPLIAGYSVRCLKD